MKKFFSQLNPVLRTLLFMGLIVLFVLLLAFLELRPAKAATFLSFSTLPAKGVRDVTISGISSGAFFSVQMGIAYSATIRGVGAIAGGVYDCAEGLTDKALNVCMAHPEEEDLAYFLRITQGLAEQNKVDPLVHVASQKVFIFAGQKDTVVLPKSGEILRDYYKALKASVVLKNDIYAGHGMPTLHKGNPCGEEHEPWLNDCGYDAAGAILSTLYGPLHPPVPMVGKNLHDFSQLEFGSLSALLANAGSIYIPTDCKNEDSHCRLHIALHGCLQNPTLVGDRYVKDAGYNEWAEANRIIVLYPATVFSEKNPRGCWDWFGYTGSDYATQKGVQMQVLKQMIDRLTTVL